MVATISVILRAVIFFCVSNTQSTLSEPAPGWQSEQSNPSAAAITPIAPMKSSTLRPLRVLVETFLKNTPAGGLLGPVVGGYADALAGVPFTVPLTAAG